VHVGRLAVGNMTPLADLLPAIVADGVASVASTGVLGDPRAASAAHGRAVLAAMVDNAFARVDADDRIRR
jgi:mycofactocin precursor peptide peptidase